MICLAVDSGEQNLAIVFPTSSSTSQPTSSFSSNAQDSLWDDNQRQMKFNEMIIGLSAVGIIGIVCLAILCCCYRRILHDLRCSGGIAPVRCCLVRVSTDSKLMERGTFSRFLDTEMCLLLDCATRGRDPEESSPLYFLVVY
jgi:hypothetical protein